MRKHTIAEWIEFFGIEVVDTDGPFASLDSDKCFKEMDVAEFVDGISQCTIRMFDGEKFARFLYIA